MIAHRPPTHRRRIGGALAAMCAVAIALVACDTGDGTTLREPTTSTTLPPPDTTPLSTLPIDPVLPSTVPLAFDTLPADSPAETVSIAPSAPPDVRADFTVIAPWATGEAVEIRNTCDGIDAAPELSWSAVPEGTQELAISFVDESDTSAGRPFIHWVMTGIDPTSGELAEDEVPPGAVEALNFFGEVGYTGPCPIPGDTSTFMLTVHALGQQLETFEATPAAEVLDLVGSVTIDSAIVSGTVTR